MSTIDNKLFFAMRPLQKYMRHCYESDS